MRLRFRRGGRGGPRVVAGSLEIVLERTTREPRVSPAAISPPVALESSFDGRAVDQTG